MEKVSIHDSKDREALEEIVERLSVAVNNISLDYDEISEIISNKFMRCHRTLQQSMIRLIACFINKISQHETDLRNEAAIKWAAEVSKIDAYFPFI
jgi:hypothetical protein